MNEKNTIVNNDETRVEPSNENSRMNQNENVPEMDASQAESRSRNKVVQNAAIGGLGIIAGVVGAMGLQAFREAPAMENPEGNPGGTAAIPEPENLEEIELAHSPEDSMSFNEAFAAARQEVGANGVFEWRGGVYGTYYADEWENFSDEYKEEFAGHDWRSEFPDTGENLARNEPETGAAFGDHDILTDENGSPYIALEDAITGEEVRISPEDLRYAVLDEQGSLIGVIGDDLLASIDNTADGYLLLDDEGNPEEFVYYEDDSIELLDPDDDGVDILNGPDDDMLIPDLVDDHSVVIDDDQFAIVEDDEVGDYLSDNSLPDYANDASIDDFIA